ncbi:sigma-54-dependent Fis family transcriptional regulator [Aggregicoccus sp. 17bor-14]|uniref:sigma-54-dependent transcriptional regulator n=1 Tax=Myxococcaceae TaxID=31 RepID=UPI00129C9963|nr:MULTISPECIES: sigma-54 dependent transcriptional regulator [Myxococcaceae]MBF5042671.1 sigma-54-dependent Fis family transcriptional regulator [Simulacricoccus sp. 17bor-14]MRI88439.1 sigma-54-dependent Fis family transcriptional regulator [Aggregicoccus sp. 17bor-14]
MPATVLIVDDEKNILLTLHQSLQLAGYRTELASSGQVALDVVSARPVDAVLMDVKMPDLDGLTALERMQALKPGLPVIMMSGHGTIDTAVRATQLGARDFLEKPIARDRLLVALRNALQHQAAMEELAELRAEVGTGRYQMVGSGPAMERIFSLIRRTAPSEGRVLITGENGTGKELIARALHQNSRRKQGPFVKLNCAAVPHELIESELFGHEKGAFTGAVSVRRGKFELAHEGTLFLDEIGDMPSAMQAKLLRVLQEGELERVGGAETLKVDVRVLAATNKDLPQEIAAGRFREDLYYRLNVVQIHSPPLRERREDLPDLIRSFLQEACAKNGRRPLQLSSEALSVMAAYDYPGNVRELRNLVERLAILCEGPSVSGAEARELLPPARAGQPPPPAPLLRALEGLSAAPPPSPAPPQASAEPVSSGFRPRADKPFRDQVEDAEREIIQFVLAHTQDNVTEAARLLDLERGHFYKKMKALGLRRGAAES